MGDCAQKKEAFDIAKLETITAGFLDTSGIESNVGVLAILLGLSSRNGYFWTVATLVGVSVLLQLIIGFILAAKYVATLRMEEADNKAAAAAAVGAAAEGTTADPPTCFKRPMPLQFIAIILLMILNVVNVFIIAFAGQIDGYQELAPTAGTM